MPIVAKFAAKSAPNKSCVHLCVC